MSRLLFEIERVFSSKLALRIEHVDPTQVHNRTFTFFGLDIQDSGTSMDYEDKINEVVFLPSSLNEAIQGEHILFYLYLASPQGQDFRQSVFSQKDDDVWNILLKIYNSIISNKLA